MSGETAKKQTLIVITGPTASGKSALAISLAEKLKTEIISADSRQVFKGIPIVTAVPSLEERKNIPHHLMEILPLEAYYSAAAFQVDAEKKLSQIFENSDSAVVCGGSMLYIDALIKGIDDLPTVPLEFRESLMKEWHDKGDNWLLDKLKEVDIDYFNKIDHRNLKRVFHAVEISLLCGKSYSSLLTLSKYGNQYPKHKDYNILKFCLNGTRDKLFERINMRVVKMMEMGLEEEARRVFHLRNLNSLNTVGLKEMFTYFDGIMKRDEAISRIQKNTRVYAKKQLTWHKRDNNIKYLDFSDSIDTNVNKILTELIILKNKS